jgi:arginyl-tRNA synthetase
MQGYICGLFFDAIDRLIVEKGYHCIDFHNESKDIIATSTHGDYQYNGLVRLENMIKKKYPDAMDCGSIAKYIIDDVKTADSTLEYGIIANITYSSVESNVKSTVRSRQFINLSIKDESIYKYFMSYLQVETKYDQTDPLNQIHGFGAQVMSNGLITKDIFNNNIIDSKLNVIVDYSSPNVAKSLHIGHLRSTIIGESIVNLLKKVGHDVMGLNHIGDWGTQFGMIIQYLKDSHSSFQNSEDSIMKFLDHADSDKLMEIYRNAKKLFDDKATSFANNSRNQTVSLQQGDGFNQTIWKRICEISSKDYTSLYRLLNINNLVERGESFYQQYIPDVIDMLTKNNLITIVEGAGMIMLDGWQQPLIVVKSDGGYGYDTTDLAALYHRLCLLKTDTIIYVTDVGQKTHFDMCFQVAEKMGWTRQTIDKSNNVTDNETNQLTDNVSNSLPCSTKKAVLRHIGFGLVSDAQGKKLKTRSGETVKMIDVIRGVVEKSETLVHERSVLLNQIKTESEGKIDNKSNLHLMYYNDMNEETKKSMCRKIAINTLKYFDLSHSHSSNYKYIPEQMFQFDGDTGVYIMYCFARINGIIEKSTLNIKRNDLNTISRLYCSLDLNLGSMRFSKETRNLLLHVIGFDQSIKESVDNLNINLLVKYVYKLSTLFNSYLQQTNGRIIGSVNENFSIAVCLVVSKIIETILNILSFEEVEHI